jgi:RNA polymerase sigma-70 factor, ECF subfamily
MGFEHLSDEQLLARVAGGDTAAHEALYDRYGSTVFGLALKITGDRPASEEVVQEAFWRVWRKADSFAVQRGAFTSWFFSIVRNLCIDTLRRRRAQVATASEFEDALDELPDPDTDVAEAAGLVVRHKQVRAAVAALPPEQRSVIELAYFRGLTRQEIAEKTGEPLGTVHSRARLAMQKLRELLLDQGFEE